MDAASLDQIAMLWTKVDPDLCAWMLVTMAQYYNEGILCVERNNHGLDTLRSLLDKRGLNQLYFKRGEMSDPPISERRGLDS